MRGFEHIRMGIKRPMDKVSLWGHTAPWKREWAFEHIPMGIRYPMEKEMGL